MDPTWIDLGWDGVFCGDGIFSLGGSRLMLNA